MSLRRISYHVREGEDAEGWIRDHAAEMRGVDGMERVEFLRSESEPSQWTALMYFASSKKLEEYKSTGPYTALVGSLREILDESKPVTEEIFKPTDL
ncbi:MAG: hypothetical protein ACXABF_15870 [Candidatus Thorarchaeota archaeon]